jgi:hypothetical protein
LVWFVADFDTLGARRSALGIRRSALGARRSALGVQRSPLSNVNVTATLSASQNSLASNQVFFTASASPPLTPVSTRDGKSGMKKIIG